MKVRAILKRSLPVINCVITLNINTKINKTNIYIKLNRIQKVSPYITNAVCTNDIIHSNNMKEGVITCGQYSCTVNATTTYGIFIKINLEILLALFIF